MPFLVTYKATVGREGLLGVLCVSVWCMERVRRVMTGSVRGYVGHEASSVMGWEDMLLRSCKAESLLCVHANCHLVEGHLAKSWSRYVSTINSLA